MKLSVIVPCFNAEDTIAVQLEALANQQWLEPWEVIVADNGSTDNTIAIAQRYQHRIANFRIVDASAKAGPSYARNLGAKAAYSESLAFCDADDQVAPGWVAAMGMALVQYEFVAGRNNNIKLNDQVTLKNHGLPETTGVTFDHPYLPVVISSNMGVKRSLHEKIGGFDEGFLMIEDIDYAWRLQEAGHHVCEIPDAIVHYRLRKDFKAICDHAWKVGIYEALLYKKRHNYPLPKQLMSWKTFIKVPIVFILELLRFKVRNKETMAEWIKVLAWRSGQLTGCLKFGFIPL
ncbi:glycosyltransferase [Calothrix sp. PCC 6303]|uniref:glycosyltransferase n=1 Tax=Calothrix sp. PCC 6303 TaxID=1170562 RepID=UPI0002A0558C|nr:glycosyltransferase [Calothrix sp. PCC 6303]AFZ03198.1 glycosyl transferase family 2 [Calothrix sp. PCC 6303]